jgi:nitroreductase/chorismate mutase
MGTTASDDTPIHHSSVSAPELIAIRDRIDAVDSQLVTLLRMRLGLVVSAGEFKEDLESVADPARVKTVLHGVRARAADCGADANAIEAIYRVIIEEGIELERLAYERGEFQGDGREWPESFDSSTDTVARGHLLGVMATMRAMRRLDNHPVSPELLGKLVEAASWAPVGANRQNYRFVIVSDRSQLARLAPHWRKAMTLYLEALQPPVDAQGASQAGRVRNAMAYQAEHFTDIPALVVVCYEPISFWRRVISDPGRALRHLRTLGPLGGLRVLCNLRRWAFRASAASVYPAVENLLLAARAHGLGATLTTWHLAFEQDFKQVLGIPPAVGIYAIVPVGYPHGRFGPVRRRPVEELVNWDSWQDAGR